ncbi:MAG: hypothetical protein ACYTGZ_03145 [Planctomycetota bacterium]|jgi:hypothetical protein
MRPRADTETVRTIMSDFAARTGLTKSGPSPRRYLWTDAFAVCNLLELHRRTGDEEHLRMALRLVDQVHRILGRHRDDDPRSGWISGLGDDEGKAHPTRGGLRIGKRLNERGPGDAFDERLEWDRDGQYFHYLTRWMHALAQVAKVTGERHYLAWAFELARAAHAGFTHVAVPGGRRRMHWKMSIDLTRPLVPSMGQHDPLDGLLTFLELEVGAARLSRPFDLGTLDTEVAEMGSMGAGAEWATSDPLGLGGLLSDALRLAQLITAGACAETRLLEVLLRAAARGLAVFASMGQLAGPAASRLAFRELGLAIGLHAAAGLRALPIRGAAIASHLDDLERFAPLGNSIEEFWLDPVNQDAPSWRAHLDIDSVMLATSLAPDSYLCV